MVHEPVISIAGTSTSNEDLIPITHLDSEPDEPVGGLKEQLASKASMIRHVIVEACAELLPTADEVAADELSIEFSLSVSGETGLPYIAKATTQGSIKVKAVWKSSQNR